MKFKVFTVADIMLTVFWDVMPPIFYRQIQMFWQNQLPPSSYSSTLKTETAGSSKTMAFIYKTMKCHIPKDCIIDVTKLFTN